jgi:hypothetical protein
MAWDRILGAICGTVQQFMPFKILCKIPDLTIIFLKIKRQIRHISLRGTVQIFGNYYNKSKPDSGGN